MCYVDILIGYIRVGVRMYVDIFSENVSTLAFGLSVQQCLLVYGEMVFSDNYCLQFRFTYQSHEKWLVLIRRIY